MCRRDIFFEEEKTPVINEANDDAPINSGSLKQRQIDTSETDRAGTDASGRGSPSVQSDT